MTVTVGVSVRLSLLLSILPLIVHSQCTDGEVRIGDTPSVEVCTNNMWGALCDNNLTLEDAAVLCRELDYSALGAQGHLAPASGTSQGPFPECTGRETTIRECPVTNTSIPEECWHVTVACQPVGHLETLEVCFAANNSEVSNPISAAELLASEIALSLYRSCACAYFTNDVHARFDQYSEGMLVFRARISYTEPLNESVAALQQSASSTNPTSIDVNGVLFTTLQECPRVYVAASAVSATPTLILGTAAKYSGLSVLPPTSSTPLALKVASSIYSVTVPPNTAVQPSSTPGTSGPTSSKPLPIAALVAGVCGGVMLIILTVLCLGVAAVSIKMTRVKNDLPKSQRPKQRQAHSYEEVDNESIMDPDHVFLNSVCEVDNISIATRTTQLTTDAIYASVDGVHAVTEQFLSLEHPYATLTPYPEPDTYIDTEIVNPYRVSEILMEDRTAPQFREVINPYAEPDVDSRGSDMETGTQNSKVNPYRVSVILLEDRTAPELQETDNPYAEPDVGTSDTETGIHTPAIDPYRVSQVLLEDKTGPQFQGRTNHKQYSSLDRDAQYATLEPYRGGLSTALQSSEDGYSRLNHAYPTTENTKPIPNPLTIMETPL